MESTSNKKSAGPNDNIRRRRTCLAWLILINVVLFVLLGYALEIATRIVVARSGNLELRMVINGYSRLARGERKRFMPAPYVNYRLRPGFQVTDREGAVTRHNRAGYRNSSEIGRKTDGTLRIVCLGASTTYGVGVADNDSTYPAQIEKLLNAEFRPEGYDKIEVVNLGVGGYTSAEVLAELHFYALPLEPDVVLIQSSINDVAPRFYDGFDPSYSHFRKLMQDPNDGPIARLAYRSWLFLATAWKLALIEPLTLQSRTQFPLPHAEVAEKNFGRNGPETFQHNLTAAVTLAQTSGARVWLLTQSWLDDPAFLARDEDMRRLDILYKEGQRQHNEIMRDLAAEQGVGLIDLAADLKVRRRHVTDPIHMNQAGNVLKAQYIARVLQRQLGRPRRAS